MVCTGASVVSVLTRHKTRRFCLFAGGEGESAHEGVSGGGFFMLTGSSRSTEVRGGRSAVITGVLSAQRCDASPQGSGGEGGARQPAVTLTHLPGNRSDLQQSILDGKYWGKKTNASGEKHAKRGNNGVDFHG